MSRKKHCYHYLYKTTNLLTNKYYYGIHSTSNLEDGYLGSGKILKYSIRKYGKDNFKREIIEFFNNREDLALAEKNLITEEMLKDKYCMNLQYGGEVFNTIGMTTVKDNDGNTFKVFCDDPRYLSGELVGIAKGKSIVKDKNNNFIQIDINDPRYLSGELNHMNKNTIIVKDDKKQFRVQINDPRYLSGELTHIWKDKKHTEETKNKMSEKAKERIGDKNSSFGTCWITKDNENKKIKKEQLDYYLNNGWFKGRKIK